MSVATAFTNIGNNAHAFSVVCAHKIRKSDSILVWAQGSLGFSVPASALNRDAIGEPIDVPDIATAHTHGAIAARAGRVAATRAGRHIRDRVIALSR